MLCLLVPVEVVTCFSILYLKNVQRAIQPMTQLLDKGQELMLVVQTLYKPHDLEGTELHKAPNKMTKCGLWRGRSGRREK